MLDPKTGLPPRFLRTPDAARFLGISIRTLEKHRNYGTGPTYRKIGGRIVYALPDLQGWVENGVRRSTTDETPCRAFDDGHKVYIVFPSGIGQGELPPLFVLGADGGLKLVNYRVRQNWMIVDRLFAAAELRLSDKHSEQRVRIVRTDGRKS
jgi:type IV secretory pathway VirB9-like protein|nr:TrbG/VirB9 family P-type conjugative transfer protein [Acetobacter fabarum]